MKWIKNKFYKYSYNLILKFYPNNCKNSDSAIFNNYLLEKIDKN